MKLRLLILISLLALSLSSCSSPFGQPDQIDIGLANLLQAHGQAALMQAQAPAAPAVLTPLAPLRAGGVR